MPRGLAEGFFCVQAALPCAKQSFVGIYNVKPLRIYTENPDPIYVIDKLQNVKELTKVSKIMNKLKDIKYSTSYIIQIK